MKTLLNQQKIKSYEKQVTILKALAHSTRLFILEQLRDQEMCVCEINEMIDIDVSTLSKHLTVMKNAGLVSSEKRGLQVFYRAIHTCMLDSLNCMESDDG